MLIFFANNITLTGQFRVYDSADARTPMTGVTAEVTTWPAGTLTASGGDLAPGEYYIPHKTVENGEDTPYTESGRRAIAVIASSGAIEAEYGTTENYGTTGSLAQAISSATDGKAYIRLKSNAKLPKDTKYSGSFELDLNGYAVTCESGTVLKRGNNANAEVTICDGSTSKSGVIDGGSYTVIDMGSSGKLTVSGGSLVSRTTNNLVNYAGNVEIKGGRLYCHGTAVYIQTD